MTKLRIKLLAKATAGEDDSATSPRVAVIFLSGITSYLKKPGRVTALGPDDIVLPTTAVIKALTPLHAQLSGHAVLSILARSGIRTSADLRKSADQFCKKATKAELSQLVSPAQLLLLDAKMRQTLKPGLRPSIIAKRPSQSRFFSNPQLQKRFNYGIIYLYAFAASKMCSALAIPLTPAVVQYLLFGTGAKVPVQLKALISGKSISQSAPKAPSIARNIEDLKPKDFKPANHDLVASLPALYAEYLKRVQGTIKLKPIDDWPSVWAKRARRALLLQKTKEMAAMELRKAVGTEMFTFFTLVIPGLKAKSISDADSKRLRELEQNVLNARRPRSMRLRSSPTTTSARTEAEEEYANNKRAANAALKQFKQHLKAGTSLMKGWMTPYVSATIDIGHVRGANLEGPALTHRLVTRANAGKVRPRDKELEAELDDSAAVTLSYRGIACIVDAYGGSTIKASNGVFSSALNVIKPKLFTSAITDSSGRGLDTPTGKVTSERLLRLNSITHEDEANIVEQFAAEFKAWNPLKTEVKDVAAAIKASTKTEASAYTVTKSSSAQLAAYRKDLPQFMSKLHSVDLRVMKSWEAHPSPKIAALLKNVKTSSKLKVIRNVFHGCAKQAGSIILQCGFKIKGTQVTGRAMGDVLYVAPCVDKSAQYLGKGFTRKSGTTGIIFMGDIIVSGDPARSAPAVKDKSFGWTKTTNFKTEEIGLVNPNMQFVIKHVFMVKVLEASKTQAPDSLAKKMATFESPIQAKDHKL